MEKQVRLGDVLIDYGYITQEQLMTAITAQKKENKKLLGEMLLEMGYITEDQLLAALSKRLGLNIVDFNAVRIDPKAVELIPKSLCLRYNLIAISKEGGKVLLALSDPMNFYAIEDVKSILTQPCEIALAKKNNIIAAIQKYYSEIDAKKALDIATTISVNARAVQERTQVQDDPQAPIISLVNSIMMKAYSEGASDIHFEPYEDTLKVRYRIDGLLIDYLSLEKSLASAICTRIKILGNLDIAERRIPQDGHFKLRLSDIDMSVRVSVVPTVFGEKTVLRFLSQNVKFDHEEQFGMSTEDFQKLSKMLQSPHGIIYITGPTGSGKTSTLYMVIERLARAAVNVMTIEDPVEKNIPRVNQVQVNVAAGLTFESGLRSFLRQDPDIILVGETRDGETAKTAVSAAITGHLVLSTLHTNDSISTIVRLEDMGIENYLVSSSLVGVVAQRLVKKICPFCKEEYTPTPDERHLTPDVAHFYRGKGCHNCNNTGYKGRIAVHEILEIDREIRTMVSIGKPIYEVYDYVKEKGELNFIGASIGKLVAQGITTVDELIRQTAFSV